MADKKRRPNAREWFGRADEFWLAATMFGLKGEHGPIIPNVVCRAFASEAYLKCLLTIRQKHFPPEHDLHLLFGLLPLLDKQAIEAPWNVHCLPILRQAKANVPPSINADLIPNTLTQALKAAANAFKDWRYQVEGPQPFMLNTFAIHVRDVIIDAHPDWRDDPPDAHGRQSKDRVQSSEKARSHADAMRAESPWRAMPGRPD
jgi:hypothetical protein